MSLDRGIGFVFLILAILPTIVASEHAENTIVISKVYNGYSRYKQSDGTFKTETYAFAEGGLFDQEPVAADSLYSLQAPKLLGILAKSLAKQNFVCSTDPKHTDLLLMVFWGDTKDTSGKAKTTAYTIVEEQNARILGFEKELAKADDLYFTAFAQDVYDELRAGRYFVVIRAFDFQLARTKKTFKLLWESRFSIRRQGSDFVEQLPLMAKFAASSFGQQNSGLIRPRIRDGKVEIGPTRVIETTEAPTSSATSDEKK